MELHRQEITMNGIIKKYNNDLKKSQLFMGDEKELEAMGDFSEIFYSVSGATYQGWENYSRYFYEELCDGFKRFYCFLSLNYWQLDSRIVRYNGLSRFLAKNYEVGLLRTEVDGYSTIDGRVNFWGIIKLTNENFTQLISLVDKLQTGVIFNASNNDDKIAELAKHLFHDLDYCGKSHTCCLNKIHAIRDLGEDERQAIFTYSNEELGDYHMSIFYK
jgi:hypothetical protein